MDTKIIIDQPHEPFGKHVDIIVPLPDINGAQKIRISDSGQILTEEIGVKGGFWKSIVDNTK